MNDKPKLVCGGLGDWIALTSFLPLPKKILLATSRAAGIGEMCRHMGVAIEILEDHWTYYSQAQVEARHGPLDVDDWNVETVFPKILAGNYKFHGCPLFKRPLARVISQSYTVLCPASMNKAPGRDMTAAELNTALQITKGLLVVVNRGDFKCNPHSRVIDLCNKTSVMEALAIVMHADAYIGIDTWEATAFAQTGKPMLIKSVNPQYYENRTIYAAPCHEKIQWVNYIH